MKCPVPYPTPSSPATSPVSSVLLALLIRIGAGPSKMFGLLINVVNLVAIVCYAVLLAYSLPSVKLFVKNRLGKLTFSDSLTLAEGSARKIVPHWSIDAEVRRRLWYSFWLDTAKRVGGPECVGRIHELEVAAREKGLHAIENYLHACSDDPSLRTEVHARMMAEFEGVDFVGLNGHWAKLWIDRFPFTAAIVYDDGSKPE